MSKHKRGGINLSKLTKELPKRSELKEELTWDLEAIFATDELWEEELAQLTKDIPKIREFKGKLGSSAEVFYELLELQDRLSERLGKLYAYSRMRYDQDTTNAFYQSMNTRAENALTLAASNSSYIVPEILAMDEGTVANFLKEKEALQIYEHMLDGIFRMRPHVLSEREEELLAKVSDPLDTASQTFSMLNNADLSFPTIKNEHGEEVVLTHGRYINFLESKDRQVRKNAFKAMHQTYGEFKNTFAATLGGNIKKNNFYAKVRNYDSARQAALNGNKIPEQVYENLVQVVNDHLPLFHRYIDLRKQVLNLDELHMYDLYTPLVQDIDMKVTYEEAQDYVLKSLAPLGEEYVNIVKEGYENRWIDVEENKGKRSGAYSSGSYGTNPYILLNWQDNVNDMYTLTHELGHSVHSYYTRKNQPYRYGNYSIFVAEVASTCNEALLNNYMLNHLEDEKQKLYLLNHFLEGFRGTVFRQTMFAEFEHNMHVSMQNGEALTAEKLTEVYYGLNQKYFGENVHSDKEIGLEWARIPHFYYNYYVYQYATGYSAATTLAANIINGTEGAVDRYLDFLKSGSSDYPIEVLKTAGVDMNSKKPIVGAMSVFEQRLTEMEQLLLK